MGKLVVFEGCDCSGKETQTKLLTDRLNREGIKTKTISFPVYDSPTGKIVGACYLGKEKMCKEYLVSGTSFFDDATLVDPLVSMAYYAADRRYNLDMINSALLSNDLVLLDRYVYSNMAHQAGKIKNKSERTFMFQILEHLEFNVCKLPRADKVIFLHVPYANTLDLRNCRDEKSLQLEKEIEHLKNAEETYLLLADYYEFDTIEGVVDGKLKSISDIHNEIYKIVSDFVE